MERDGLSLDFSLLHVDFISAENDGNVFANADKVTYENTRIKFLLAAIYRFDLRCQFGTFLYVMREVTSNMMMPHCPLM